jgi:DNA polymerase-3 subunit epsilon
MTEDWDRIYWTTAPMLIFDFETTGLSGEDRICEVALVVAREGEVLERYHTLVNPGRDIGPEAVSIHGISNADVRHAPQFEDILPELRPFFLRDIPWISHNLSFDLRMLSYGWPAKSWPQGIPTLCTLSFARNKHPTTRMRGTHKLPDLANYFYVDYEASKLHQADYDTEVLAQIVPKMMSGRTVGEGMTRYSHDWRR